MKDKIKVIFEKVKEVTLKVVKRINKKAIVAACAITVLLGAVILNYVLLPENDKKTDGKLDVALDLKDVSQAIADKEKEEQEVADIKDETVDVFAEMTMSRKKARDEAMEVLTGVAQSSTAIDSMKQEALSEIQKIAGYIECESNIESLVMAKGFEECVAIVNGDTASIVVKTDGLMDTQVAQISEIVYTQAGIHPDNLNIIESDKK
ncbi:MAG: SpoIIIAH-like family protein [Clostridia bacterium]|nr:SpoIIIAH-like family protein [Clostridia bacterium]